jgi:hypothetical protein
MRWVDVDDASVLSDIGIFRVVRHSTPGAVSNTKQFAGRIPGRRFTLKRREGLGWPAGRGCDRHVRPIALHLEQDGSVGGHARRVRVAIERGQLSRLTAVDRNGPEVYGAARIPERHVGLRAVRRKGDRTVSFPVGMRRERRAATGQRHARAAVFHSDAGNATVRRERRKSNSHRNLANRHDVAGRRPQLVAVHAIGDSGHARAVRRPHDLAEAPRS